MDTWQVTICSRESADFSIVSYVEFMPCTGTIDGV